jgi:hypothetical protein
MIPAPGTSRLIQRNSTPENVARIMVDVIRQVQHTPEVLSLCRQLQRQGGDPVTYRANLARYAYDNIYFEEDPPTEQRIRTPRRSMIDRRANCVDYTVFISALALQAGLVPVVRIVRYPGEKQFTHVYPLINGESVDVVPIQAKGGTEILTRKPGIDVATIIGVELPFAEHRDFLV